MDNAKLNIKVCIGSACHLKGSYEVISSIQSILEEEQVPKEIVDVAAVFCMGECTKAVSVQVNEEPVESLSPAGVKEFFDTRIRPRM